MPIERKAVEGLNNLTNFLVDFCAKAKTHPESVAGEHEIIYRNGDFTAATMLVANQSSVAFYYNDIHGRQALPSLKEAVAKLGDQVNFFDHYQLIRDSKIQATVTGEILQGPVSIEDAFQKLNAAIRSHAFDKLAPSKAKVSTGMFGLFAHSNAPNEQATLQEDPLALDKNNRP